MSNNYQIFVAISTIFEGDYTPEEEILAYTDEYKNDEAYFTAIAKYMDDNPAWAEAFVEGAKLCFKEQRTWETIEEFQNCYANEYETIKKFVPDFFDF